MFAHLQALRPHQWVKNGFVFAALVFSRQLTNTEMLVRSVVVFAAFCAVASAIYLLNDVADYERDRLHPRKKNRPIASGAVSKSTALMMAAVLGPAGIAGGLWLNEATAIVLAFYVGMNLLYSTRLKHIVLIDVFIIAFGFLLRVTVGATAIEVGISAWLLLCTFFVALLIGFGKRRGELTLLGESAAEHRGNLGAYSISFLDNAIASLAGVTIICYSLYAIDPAVIARLRTDGLLLTLPFVVFGIFRWILVANTSDDAGSPTRLLLSNRSLQATVVLYGLAVLALIYFEVNLGLATPR